MRRGEFTTEERPQRKKNNDKRKGYDGVNHVRRRVTSQWLETHSSKRSLVRGQLQLVKATRMKASLLVKSSMPTMMC